MKSVISCFAKFPEHFQTCDDELPQGLQHMHVDERIYLLPKFLQVFTFIQIKASARVSEVLNLNASDIIKPYSIRFKALKGGVNYIVEFPELYEWLSRFNNSNNKLFNGYNYNTIRRHYIKAGFILQRIDKKNLAITHSIRHEKATSIRNAGLEELSITSALHHKNSKTSMYYGTEQQQRGSTSLGGTCSFVGNSKRNSLSKKR